MILQINTDLFLFNFLIITFFFFSGLLNFVQFTVALLKL